MIKPFRGLLMASEQAHSQNQRLESDFQRQTGNFSAETDQINFTHLNLWIPIQNRQLAHFLIINHVINQEISINIREKL